MRGIPGLAVAIGIYAEWRITGMDYQVYCNMVIYSLMRELTLALAEATQIVEVDSNG